MSGEFKKLLAQGRLDEKEMGSKERGPKGFEAEPEAVEAGTAK